MRATIGLATDAPEAELPAIRETLNRVLGISPNEPRPGTWFWYGMFRVAELKDISKRHPDSTFWLEWDLDYGEICTGQYEAYEGAIKHVASIAGMVDDDEDIFKYGMCYEIVAGEFDRTRVKRLPADRPRRVTPCTEYHDYDPSQQQGSGDRAREIPWES